MQQLLCSMQQVFCRKHTNVVFLQLWAIKNPPKRVSGEQGYLLWRKTGRCRVGLTGWRSILAEIVATTEHTENDGLPFVGSILWQGGGFGHKHALLVRIFQWFVGKKVSISAVTGATKDSARAKASQ